MSVGYTGSIMVGGALTAIIISSLGLAGICSLQTVSITSICTTLINPIGALPQLIAAILGLTGVASMGVVSGVTLAFSLVALMVGMVLCHKQAKNLNHMPIG